MCGRVDEDVSKDDKGRINIMPMKKKVFREYDENYVELKKKQYTENLNFRRRFVI